MDVYREYRSAFSAKLLFNEVLSQVPLYVYLKKTVHNALRPIVHSCRKAMRKAAMIIVTMIRDSVPTFGLRIYQKVKKFIQKFCASHDKVLSRRTTFVVFLSSLPYVRSLLSFFDDISSDIMDAFLIPQKTKASLIM